MKEKRQTYNLLVSVLLLLGIVLFPRTGRPQVGTIPLAGPVDVQAGRLEILKEEGIVQATGGIVLSWGERRVSADSALYRFREGIIEARGNVSYSDGEVEFSAESVLVDVKTGLVSLKKAVLRVRKEHIFVQAEEFVEEEKDLFRVKKARFTTCDECEERDWEIGIGRGKVELGGYATGSNITLLVRGKTLFWVPYAFFPAKTKRETGFLVPSFSSDSTRGVRFIVPFYVVTSSSSDVTLNFDYMTERGFKPAAEVRFRLTQDSEGKIQGEYIKDRKVGEERFALTGGTVITGDFPFFMNWKSRYASDETYFVDFRDEIFLRTARQSISDGAFGLEGDSLASYAGFTYVQNLDPAGDSKTTKNVLPTIDFRVKRFPFLKIFSVFGDVRFKNFYSALEGAVEKGDARFRFVTPIKFFDRFLFDMDTEVYGGAYRTKNPGGGKEIEEIAYVDSVLTLSTLLSRRYGRTIHQVRPSFSFQKTDRLTNPPSVEFEPTDRAPEKMRLLGGLDMRFIRLGEGELRELGSFSLRYSYDVQREEKIQATLLDPFSPYYRTYQDQIDIAVEGTISEDKRSDLYLSGEFSPWESFTLGGEAFYNTRFGRMDKFSLDVEYSGKRDLSLSGTLRHTRKLATDLNLSLSFLPFRWLRYSGWINYSIKDNVIIENTSYLEYIPSSRCWSVTLGASRKTKPPETTYSLFFTLRGIGSLGR